ncbi:IS1182 family transposase [Arthrobacter sp. PAMC25564]|uniref:IS1182 family transposase n=1 Tax=Arthrobacter sp. PAMC25564 TaxID=2565366 RepID=UPI0010A25F05|nr:IS1182 family transposase [Arthrobacter sp. PAMC25564]QCB95624.1 IS1182 family transposase [Arthrobacter sp. PAMC25564]QCB96657.1 IS1182 family transposase [Arthrobacter sp. PAMC25564]QCB97256.1 IS1182 family transposase [Arthrobacter sp. PAMC25564]QCB98017.1 IS1182 family transposase [Arthrobacter sp. PAMC25564]
MQGREREQRTLLDVEALAGELLAPGSVFAFLAEHRGRLFPDSMMEDLFGSKRGRPSVPAPVIGSVLVLQALQGLSDRETAEALTYDLRWKAACGYALTDTAFHPTTLVYWRKRLAASANPHRIMDAVTEVVTATGILKGRNRRALDSTVLDDAVARQDTVTQLIAAVRRFGRDVPGGKDLIAAHATGYDYTRAGKPDIAWDDAQARDELISALVNDALALLAAVDPQQFDKNPGDPSDAGDPKAAEAYALLALVAGQDVEPAEDSDGTDGRWKIARKTAPDRMISIVDPDARHAHKTRKAMRDGYKAHIVNEPGTGIVTAAAVTKAAGPGSSDAEAGAGLLSADPTVEENQQVDALGDSAYGTGDMLKALAAAGHRALVKPKPLAAAIAGGFTIDDFAYDKAAGTLTCPNGLSRRITAKGRVTFGAACRGCPLKDRCTTAAGGRKIELHPDHELMRAHRAAARNEDFQSDYKQHRPMVERSIAWLTAGNNRRLRYLGVAKNDAWFRLRAGAVNLKRLLSLGLTVREGAWAIA